MCLFWAILAKKLNSFICKKKSDFLTPLGPLGAWEWIHIYIWIKIVSKPAVWFLRAKHSPLTCCDKLDINGFLTSGQLKNLLPKIMQPGTLTKSGGTITLPQFKIKQKFDLKDSLSQVWKCYMFYWYTDKNIFDNSY